MNGSWVGTANEIGARTVDADGSGNDEDRTPGIHGSGSDEQRHHRDHYRR